MASRYAVEADGAPSSSRSGPREAPRPGTGDRNVGFSSLNEASALSFGAESEVLTIERGFRPPSNGGSEAAPPADFCCWRW